MNITVAIIGLGIMGRRMLEHMNRHDAFTPVALWDPDPDACQAAQQLCPQAVITSSADAAIDAVDVDALDDWAADAEALPDRRRPGSTTED